MKYLARVTGQHPARVFLHAEVAAILRAKDQQVHTLTVERYMQDGSPALAAPCPMCAHFIEMMNVKRVIHT
jgi:deoxycytidylate deaminase